MSQISYQKTILVHFDGENKSISVEISDSCGK